jgi:hypothetical protein
VKIFEAATKNRARLRAIRAAQKDANRDQADIARQVSIQLTSGPTRSRAARSPVRPVLPIGRRSRRLVRGWRVQALSAGGSVVARRQLYNVAPHSKYVLAPGGTRRMASRRLWEALMAISRPRLREVAREHINLALRGQ